MNFQDLDLLQVGHSIQLVGSVWCDGKDGYLILPFPWEEGLHHPYSFEDTQVVRMDFDNWQEFLRQSDEKATEVIAEGPDGKLQKAILRKSNRQIDQRISWQVYRRDNFTCRYCNADDCPMTVDHLVLWEKGGPSIPPNLLTSCRSCNSKRGNTEYADWLNHKYYQKVSRRLPADVVLQNYALLDTLDAIPRRVHKKGR